MLERNGFLGQQLLPQILPMTTMISYLDNSISVVDVIEGVASLEVVLSKMLNVIQVYGPVLENQKLGK